MASPPICTATAGIKHFGACHGIEDKVLTPYPAVGVSQFAVTPSASTPASRVPQRAMHLLSQALRRCLSHILTLLLPPPLQLIRRPAPSHPLNLTDASAQKGTSPTPAPSSSLPIAMLCLCPDTDTPTGKESERQISNK